MDIFINHYSSYMIGVVAILTGIIIHKILTVLLKHWSARKSLKIKGAPLRLDYLNKSLRILIPILCLTLATPFLSFPEQVHTTIKQVLFLMIIGAVAWMCIQILAVIREMIIGLRPIDIKDNLRARRIHTQIRVIERILTILIIVIALSYMLLTFEKVRQIGISILASAGVLGIIIGFAAQRSIATLIAGIQIAITQPIRLDDVVIVENEWGRIEEITLTYVVVKIWDQRRLILPITYFIEKPFQNWTRTSAEILGTVFIYADYTLPVQKLREKLYDILEKTSLWDKRVWGMQVTNMTEHTIELRALMSAENASNAWELRCYVREKLIDYIKEEFPESLPRVRLKELRR